jgi:hypothetical protein
VNTSSHSTAGYAVIGYSLVGLCSIQQGKAFQKTQGGINPSGKFLNLLVVSSGIIIQSQRNNVKN